MAGIHDHSTDHEARVELMMQRASELRAELVTAMRWRTEEDAAWDLRADAIGYVEDDTLFAWERDGLGLDDIGQALDDDGHHCRDCGEVKVPGHPGEDGPQCAECGASEHANTMLRAVGGDL